MRPPGPDGDPLQRGTKLGPYTLIELIGAGEMGSVWKAEDTRLDRVVAIKTCDERFSERFEREALAIAALNHPDMRWVAFSSYESAGSGADIYVRPFRVSETGLPALGDSKWQISTGTGNWARWRSADEILINTRPLSPALFAVAVDTSGVAVDTSGVAFESGIPERLLALPNSGADVTADGQRVLIAAPTAQRSVPSVITVVLNWPALVSK